MSDGNYHTGIMALPLFEGALDGLSGYIYFSEAMETDKSELEAFDESFPRRKKLILDSQAEFEKASGEIDYKE